MSWDGSMYNKYKIEHTDGTPLKGKKYFVLRLDSDDPIEAARVARAMRAYEGKLRNCDVGTEEEQYRRYKCFCKSHQYISADSEEGFSPIYVCSDKSCPLHRFYLEHGEDACEFAWTQMPYEEQEGAGNERR